MFKIRTELVERFAAARFEDFEGRLVAHLREYFPQEIDQLSPEGTKDLVHEFVGRSEAFGLTSERAIACFAHVALLFGPNIELGTDWEFMRNLLRDEEYHPDYRAQLAMKLAHDLDELGDGVETSDGGES